MEQLKGIVALVEEAIENGATTVEDVHREIAAKPLEILKNITPIAPTADKIEKIQDETIGSIYDTIRLINSKVAEVAKQMLNKIDQ
ncbi:MAG: hypothetical protein R2730_12320 [Chitinophagales bacterium]